MPTLPELIVSPEAVVTAMFPLTIRERLDAVEQASRDRRVRPGGNGDVSVAVRLRADAVTAAADISGLTDGNVAVVCCIQILGKDAAESGAGAGDIPRSVDEDVANAGCALLGGDAAAGLADDRPGRGNRDRTGCVLNGGDTARRSGDWAGQVYAQICGSGLSTAGRAQIDGVARAACYAGVAGNDDQSACDRYRVDCAGNTRRRPN